MRTAGYEHFDAAKIEAFRKEFLTLMSNTKRVDSYAKIQEFRKALYRWRERFTHYFYRIILDHDLLNRKFRKEFTEEMADYWEKKIREAVGMLDHSLMPPVHFASEYMSESACLYRYETDAPKWEQKVRRYSSYLWGVLRQYATWYEKELGRRPRVFVEGEERVVLEGFPVMIYGYNPAEKYHAEYMETSKAGLRVFRERVRARAPWLLRAMQPLWLNFRYDLDAGGQHEFDRIQVWAANQKNPEMFARVVVHEIGHEVYQRHLKPAQQLLWRAATQGAVTRLDLREALKKWPDRAWVFEMSTQMARTDPLLGLQIESLHHDHAYKHYRWDGREDVEKYLEGGGDPLVTVPLHPITGYAAKTPEEAFCEALSLFVVHGDRALLPPVLDRLKMVLPMIRVGVARAAVIARVARAG